MAPPLSSASLLSLELVGCEALTADALHATLRRSPELRSLDIRGCDTVGASLGPSAALEVPERLLTQLSLTAEPALVSLFFMMAARASAEELEQGGRGRGRGAGRAAAAATAAGCRAPAREDTFKLN